MEREIAAGRAPGVSMLIARNGKVGFAKTLGALGRMAGNAARRDLPDVDDQADRLGRGDDARRGGGMLITDPVSNFIPAFAETKVGVENGDRPRSRSTETADYDLRFDAAHVRAHLRLHRNIEGAKAGRGLEL